MNSTIKTNNLSFYNDYGSLTLSAKQYDTGRKFIFRIMNENEPFDLSGFDCYIRIKKADGTEFQGEDCCVIDGNNIIIDTTLGNGDQILTAAGFNLCELHLTDNANVSLTTWTFAIDVVPRVHDGNGIISTVSWDELDKLRILIEDMEKKSVDLSFLSSTEKGVAGGIAELDINGKVPISQTYNTNEIWASEEPEEAQRTNDYLIIEY